MKQTNARRNRILAVVSAAAVCCALLLCSYLKPILRAILPAEALRPYNTRPLYLAMALLAVLMAAGARAIFAAMRRPYRRGPWRLSLPALLAAVVFLLVGAADLLWGGRMLFLRPFFGAALLFCLLCLAERDMTPEK